MSLLDEEDVDVLRRLRRVLATVHPRPLIAGGQAARLLRLHPRAAGLEWPSVLTSDYDVATVDRGHVGGDLLDSLRAEGFTPIPEGDDHPPLTRYVRGRAEVEFLVPALSARRRPSRGTVPILGASAQTVEHLEPLLVEPVEVEVPEVGTVTVPNPAAYIIQKVLTVSNRRSLQKKGKDALYIHDALLLFTHQGLLDPDVAGLAVRVVTSLGKRATKLLRLNAAKLGDASSDFVAESARQAQGRPRQPSAQSIALANRLGLGELLGC